MEILNQIFGFLTSDILLYGLVVFFLTKSSISIFKMGVMFKSKLVTEDEISEFRNEIRITMVSWKKDLSEQTMNTMNAKLDREEEKIDRVMQENQRIREDNVRLQGENKALAERMVSLEKLGQNMGSLDRKVERIAEQVNAMPTANGGRKMSSL